MKRVKAACILQTLVFMQNPGNQSSREMALSLNHKEIESYKATMDKAKTRYQIVDETEQDDGSVIIHVRKQYNDKADVSEYFA